MQVKSFLAIFASAFAIASAYERKTEIFDGPDCTGSHMIDRTLKTGSCHTMKKNLKVPELNAEYGHIKMSGDIDNEVYFFSSKDECEKYGDSFNAAIEVTFIRAPGADTCYNIVRGGNAQSVRFTAPGDEKVENKSAGASQLIISSVFIVLVSAAGQFF